VSPDGKYLVGLNKLSHGRHLSVGPSQPESMQLERTNISTPRSDTRVLRIKSQSCCHTTSDVGSPY
jgi:nitrous oxide reductase